MSKKIHGNKRRARAQNRLDVTLTDALGVAARKSATSIFSPLRPVVTGRVLNTTQDDGFRFMHPGAFRTAGANSTGLEKWPTG
jgi:hypothetical protein